MSAPPAAPVADPFAQLNPAQRAAVEHGIGPDGRIDAGPLLVVAGAGSGKTLTLASRLARLVLAGADPQRILLLTFSRRAAQDLAQRAARTLHQALGCAPHERVPALPWAGTFHSIGARLLREYALQLGLAENFTVHDRGDAEDQLNLLRAELKLAAAVPGQRFPQGGTCLAIYSRVVNAQLPLEQALQAGWPWCLPQHDALKALFRAYVAAKQQQHALDFDDLLLYWAQMMAESGLAAHVGQRFDHVLVDEYQDTNRLQARILLALKPDGRGVAVVGDDAQSIYGFRAAEVRNILEFPQQYPAPARIVTLDCNYRSTQALLAASNAVIAQARERHAKELWSARGGGEPAQLVAVEDEAAQARWVADRVLQHREDGVRLQRQAVLFRTSHHSAPLELELTRRRIPFVKFGGLKFLEAAHVKDLLALLRFAENPRSRMAGFRAARLVPGLGPASVQRLLDRLAGVVDPAAALQDWQPPPAAAAAWRGFAALQAALAAQPAWPADVELALAWYRPQLERLHDDVPARWSDLQQLARLAGGHADRATFLTELTLDPPAASSAEAGPPLRDEDYLILSTIHSAKGQEWPVVYLLNLVDGCIPSDLATGSAAEIEEERRLLYVALTRAARHLHLLVPQRFHVSQQGSGGGRHVYAALSRFVVPQVEASCTWLGARRPPPGTAAVAGLPGGSAVDLGARVRSLWD